MTRYVALLRAVNVGGRTVKMDSLRTAFEDVGFDDIATFIAIGNVLYGASGARSTTERTIEAELAQRFGFEVTTFLRTVAELEAKLSAVVSPSVAFAKVPLTAPQSSAVDALVTDIDRFVVDRAEIHWTCKRKQSESKFSNVRLERAIGAATTLRSITIVGKLAERLRS